MSLASLSVARGSRVYLQEHCLNYTRELESKEKYKLCIWPEHCLVGTPGHAVVPEINDAIQQWCRQQKKMISYVHKSENQLTEMYSVIEAEVEIPTDPSTRTNKALLSRLKIADQVSCF